MQRRLLTALAMAAALLAGIVFTSKPAAAQQPEQDYYTYASEWAVPRAQWAAFDKQAQSEEPTMKKLVADGTLVAWGDDAARVHQLDGYTHSTWMIATSRANLLEALEVIWASATNASYVATTKHQDYFLHTIAHAGKSATDGAGYLRLAFYQAKPGDAGAFEGVLLNLVKPALDSAVADGTLLMYNIDTEDIHTAEPGGYDLAMLFPDGAAMDKFYADLAAREKADSRLSNLFNALTVGKEHRDSLDRVVSYEHK